MYVCKNYSSTFCVGNVHYYILSGSTNSSLCDLALTCSKPPFLIWILGRPLFC